MKLLQYISQVEPGKSMMGSQARSKLHSGLDSFVNREQAAAIQASIQFYMQTNLNTKEVIKIIAPSPVALFF